MYRPNGKLIKALRDAKNLSARAVYDVANIHPRTLKTWEDGTEKDFLFNRLARLAEVLGVPYADLIEDVTDPVEAEA